MRGLLRRRHSDGGLTGIGLHADGLSLVHAQFRNNRQVAVAAAEYRPFQGMSPVRALARLAADYDLKHRRCVTYLRDSEYRLLQTEAPDVKPDELRAALRWRIKDLIDFHVNDAALDVFDVPGGVAGRPQPVYVVVARNETIKARADLMLDAGVALEIIDIPDLAQRNVARLLAEDARGVAVVSLTENAALITITRAGSLYLSRALGLGPAALEDAQVQETILLELQRSLDYFESSFRQEPITDVIVAGTKSDAVMAFLQANLSQRVRSLDYAEIVFPEAGVVIPDACFMTLGAALRFERVAL